MFLIALSIIIGLFVCLLIFLLIKSPGIPEQYLDHFGTSVVVSISEKTFVTIGGVKQGMFRSSKK